MALKLGPAGWTGVDWASKRPSSRGSIVGHRVRIGKCTDLVDSATPAHVALEWLGEGQCGGAMAGGVHRPAWKNFCLQPEESGFSFAGSGSLWK